MVVQVAVVTFCERIHAKSHGSETRLKLMEEIVKFRLKGTEIDIKNIYFWEIEPLQLDVRVLEYVKRLAQVRLEQGEVGRSSRARRLWKLAREAASGRVTRGAAD